MGLTIHEGDHANNQSLYDEANMLRDRPAALYKPELTGAARAARSVDLYMQAEVSGWYAELQSLRAQRDAGRISDTEYTLRVQEGTVNANLIDVEMAGKAQGLSGAALASYVSQHGKGTIPSSYVDTYTSLLTPAGVSPTDVRTSLGYAFSDPATMLSFTEEAGPEGSYVATAIYSDGQRKTTVFDGSEGIWSHTVEVLQPDGTYRPVQGRTIEVNPTDGAAGDETQVRFDDRGRPLERIETDGAHDNPDFATRTTTYDAQGRVDVLALRRDDGTRDWIDYDQAGEQRWSRLDSHFDAQDRQTQLTVLDDSGSRVEVQFDADGQNPWSSWHHAFDVQNIQTNFTIVDDSGSRLEVQLDPYDQFAWSASHHAIDARNHETNFTIVDDSGSRLEVQLDAYDQFAWGASYHAIDTQNQETNFSIVDDSGSRLEVQLDPYDQFAWSASHHAIDAQDHETNFTIVDDSGSRLEVQLDPCDQYDWSASHHAIDAQNRETNYTIVGDDSSRVEVDLDEQGDQAWRDQVSHFSSADELLDTHVDWDNGSASDSLVHGSQPFPPTAAAVDAMPNDDPGPAPQDAPGWLMHLLDNDGALADVGGSAPMTTPPMATSIDSSYLNLVSAMASFTGSGYDAGFTGSGSAFGGGGWDSYGGFYDKPAFA